VIVVYLLYYYLLLLIDKTCDVVLPRGDIARIAYGSIRDAAPAALLPRLLLTYLLLCLFSRLCRATIYSILRALYNFCVLTIATASTPLPSSRHVLCVASHPVVYDRRLSPFAWGISLPVARTLATRALTNLSLQHQPPYNPLCAAFCNARCHLPAL